MFVPFSPLATDALEVSLFGTGVGEAIAMHVGEGDWVLVDSCRPRAGEEPLNLAYLRSLGVDPATKVKLIVATHWHDDHVDGLGELVEKCPSAGLAFSQAVATDEFLCILTSFTDTQITFDAEKSGVREMGRCLTTLHRRKLDRSPNYQAPVRTQAEHRVFRRGDCELFSLSPSPAAIQNATDEIAAMWRALEEEARGGNGARPARSGIPCPERNLNAVALWMKWGDRRILLGADLEEHGDHLQGWQAVLSCGQFPDSRAGVFKIPHHGSPNGDYGRIWDEIVVPDNPLAILSAYNRGRTPRPAPNDIQRISNRSNNIYYTSLPRNTPNRYDRTVERTIHGVVKRRRSLGPTPGHVRVRLDSTGAVDVQFAGAAGKIGLPAQ